ncbi:MAG: hypothetical protein EBX57_05650, partial [Betaproteobacteria bacterium]|nr:hypothetical protein [Betaproteobacteria bacterium]
MGQDFFTGERTPSAFDQSALRVNFISPIHAHQIAIDAAVSSSNASSELLRSLGIRVIDPNTVEHLPLYVDGADEVDPQCRLIKGG